MPLPVDPEFVRIVPKDPFPGLTFAKTHLWSFLDHFAWRRMLRLGIPSPWQAYAMGYEAARIEARLEKTGAINVPRLEN